MKVLLLVATVLQIVVATQSEGLWRAVLELSAFLTVAALLLEFTYKKSLTVD